MLHAIDSAVNPESFCALTTPPPRPVLDPEGNTNAGVEGVLLLPTLLAAEWVNGVGLALKLTATLG